MEVILWADEGLGNREERGFSLSLSLFLFEDDLVVSSSFSSSAKLRSFGIFFVAGFEDDGFVVAVAEVGLFLLSLPLSSSSTSSPRRRKFLALVPLLIVNGSRSNTLKITRWRQCVLRPEGSDSGCEP